MPFLNNGASAGFSAETEALLLGMRTPSHSIAGELRGLFEVDFDWNRFASLLTRHKIMSVACRNLCNDIVGDLIPVETQERLNSHRTETSKRNLILAHELVEIHSIFSARGINAMSFKGPLLAIYVYGDIGLREFGDLDIIIRRDDVEEAAQILLQKGYQWHFDKAPDWRTYFKSHCNITFFQDSKPGNIIELHWKFSQAAYFPTYFESAWEGRTEVLVAGAAIPTLKKELALVYLCAHGCKHLWSQLKWLCDIYELLQGDIDWRGVRGEAKARGNIRTLHIGLRLAHSLLGSNIPEEIDRSIDMDPRGRSLSRQIQERLLSATEAPLGCPRRMLFLCGLNETLRGKAWVLRHAAIPSFTRLVSPNSRDRGLIRLPRWLWFIYYIIRPLRLISSRSFVLANRVLSVLCSMGLSPRADEEDPEDQI